MTIPALTMLAGPIHDGGVAKAPWPNTNAYLGAGTVPEYGS